MTDDQLFSLAQPAKGVPPITEEQRKQVRDIIMSVTVPAREQPNPIPNGERPSWDGVIADIKCREFGPRNDTHIREVLIEDCRKRDEFGIRKYGTPLQPFNGRDSLLDIYEETLDQVVYIKTAIAEGMPLYTAYNFSMSILFDIRRRLYLRDGK